MKIKMLEFAFGFAVGICFVMAFGVALIFIYW